MKFPKQFLLFSILFLGIALWPQKTEALWTAVKFKITSITAPARAIAIGKDKNTELYIPKAGGGDSKWNCVGSMIFLFEEEAGSPPRKMLEINKEFPFNYNAPELNIVWDRNVSAKKTFLKLFPPKCHLKIDNVVVVNNEGPDLSCGKTLIGTSNRVVYVYPVASNMACDSVLYHQCTQTLAGCSSIATYEPIEFTIPLEF